MSFGVKTINSPNIISDATVANNYSDDGSIDIIFAKGENIQFAKYQKEIVFQNEFRLFGEIANVISIGAELSQEKNILVVLSNSQYAILSINCNGIKTKQFGYLSSSNKVTDYPFKYAVNDYFLVININNNLIQILKITEESMLDYSYNCFIPGKDIIELEVLNNDPDLIRVGVLISDFDKLNKLLIYDIDNKSKLAPTSPSISIKLSLDSYKFIVVNNNVLIVLSSSVAKYIFMDKNKKITQKTSTIFCSNPINAITKLSNNCFICSDLDGNLLILDLYDSGLVTLKRIGKIDVSMKLLSVSKDTIISISKYGKCYLINHEQKKIIPIIANSGKVNKILKLNNNEYIGISSDNNLHIINTSLKFNPIVSTEIPMIKNAWFFDDKFLVTTVYGTFLLLFNQNKFERIEDERFITNEETLSFCSSPFIQITKTKITNSKTEMEFQEILCSSISNSTIGLVVYNNNQNSIFIAYFDLKIISNIVSSRKMDCIAVNKKFIAISSWDENLIDIYSIENNNIIKSISRPAVDLVFINDDLIVLEPRDKCYRYSILNDNEVEQYQCEGIHNSITSVSDNSIILTGEQPVIIKDGVINGLDFTKITKCSNSDNKYLFICGDILTLCESNGFSLTAKYGNFDSNVIDILKLPEINKYIIASQDHNEISFSISKHPLFKQNHILSYKTTKKFVGFSAIDIFSYIFIVTIIENQFNLYELYEEKLTFKKSIKLHKPPIQITNFLKYLLIGFEDEVKLYEIEYISNSEININEVTSILTQGSTSSISTNNSFIIVSDSLQSIVLYSFDENNQIFNEIARNCNDYGFSHCKILNDNIFGSDYFGNLYYMKMSHSRNIDSFDINIYSSYSFGQDITFITSFSKEDNILIGTQNGQYFEIHEFYPSAQLKLLYKEIESTVKSLGLFNSFDFRHVTKRFHPIKSDNMFNLDLFQYYLGLSNEDKTRICRSINISCDDAEKMCKCICLSQL